MEIQVKSSSNWLDSLLSEETPSVACCCSFLRLLVGGTFRLAVANLLHAVLVLLHLIFFEDGQRRDRVSLAETRNWNHLQPRSWRSWFVISNRLVRSDDQHWTHQIIPWPLYLLQQKPCVRLINSLLCWFHLPALSQTDFTINKQ